MTFMEVATLLMLIGGAIYGTFQISSRVFEHKKDNRDSDQT